MIHVQKGYKTTNDLNEREFVIIFDVITRDIDEPFVAIEADDTAEGINIELNYSTTDAAHDGFHPRSCNLSYENIAREEE
jgi:hypothetical protein